MRGCARACGVNHARRLVRASVTMLDAFEDDPDVQHVFHNAE